MKSEKETYVDRGGGGWSHSQGCVVLMRARSDADLTHRR